MFQPPLDLSKARILITNDDGIRSREIAQLYEIAKTLSDDVWVCAPESEQSATSHSLTITRPLRIMQEGEKRFSVDGTPTDCVLLAINHIMQDNPPDLVLSGINMGSNIGDDVTYSGTIAAAMEATLLGVPAIALSQHIEDPEALSWDVAHKYGPDAIRKAVSAEWGDDVLVNINFPSVSPENVTGIEVVRHGKRKIGDHIFERIDPRGKPYIWIGVMRGEVDVPDDTDIAVVLKGGVSVTPLSMDLNHPNTHAKLKAVFDQDDDEQNSAFGQKNAVGI